MNWRKIFYRKTPLILANIEMAEAQVAMLSACSGVEYASALVTYNQKRIERLRKYINDETKAKAKNDRPDQPI